MHSYLSCLGCPLPGPLHAVSPLSSFSQSDGQGQMEGLMVGMELSSLPLTTENPSLGSVHMVLVIPGSVTKRSAPLHWHEEEENRRKVNLLIFLSILEY